MNSLHNINSCVVHTFSTPQNPSQKRTRQRLHPMGVKKDPDADDANGKTNAAPVSPNGTNPTSAVKKDGGEARKKDGGEARKKDVSTAILERKKAPNRLVVGACDRALFSF